jgi:hypothetical protein
LNIEKRIIGNTFQSGESWSGLEIKADDKKKYREIFGPIGNKKIKFTRTGITTKARESPQFKIMVIP